MQKNGNKSAKTISSPGAKIATRAGNARHVRPKPVSSFTVKHRATNDGHATAAPSLDRPINIAPPGHVAMRTLYFVEQSIGHAA